MENFNLVHAHKKLSFAIACSEPLFFLSFFSVLLLWLPFAFHILSGCLEKLGVNYGQSLAPEMDLEQLEV